MTLFLLAKALQKTAFMAAWKSEVYHNNVIPIDPRRVGYLLFAGLLAEILLIAPARVILIRQQASVLPSEQGQRTVINFDDAISSHGGGSDKWEASIGMRKAWATVSRRARLRYVIVYTQVLLAVLFGGGAVLFFGFAFYISIAMTGWRF